MGQWDPTTYEGKDTILRVVRHEADELFALVEPGSCFAGTLLELALAADRTYMLALPDDADVVEADLAQQCDAVPAALAVVGELVAGPGELFRRPDVAVVEKDDPGRQGKRVRAVGPLFALLIDRLIGELHPNG